MILSNIHPSQPARMGSGLTTPASSPTHPTYACPQPSPHLRRQQTVLYRCPIKIRPRRTLAHLLLGRASHLQSTGTGWGASRLLLCARLRSMQRVASSSAWGYYRKFVAAEYRSSASSPKACASREVRVPGSPRRMVCGRESNLHGCSVHEVGYKMS